MLRKLLLCDILCEALCDLCETLCKPLGTNSEGYTEFHKDHTELHREYFQFSKMNNDRIITVHFSYCIMPYNIDLQDCIIPAFS